MNGRLYEMLLESLRPDYAWVFVPTEADAIHRELIGAADKLCAYLKCLEEMAAGNQEFSTAEKGLRAAVEKLGLPEVRYFVETFVPSFRLTLDELD